MGLGKACSPNDIEDKRLSAPASVSADSFRDPQFGRIANLAALMFEVSIALITLIEDDHLCVKSAWRILLRRDIGLDRFLYLFGSVARTF